MSFFSTPPMSLLRRTKATREELRARVGADVSPFNIAEFITDSGIKIAIYSSKTTGFPIWAYAEQYDREEDSEIKGQTRYRIWLYLAQAGIPIFSMDSTPPRWTSVSRYVAQSATAADATLIETVDVSKGGVIRSGQHLYASDALGVSEVDMGLYEIKIKAAKGLARITFNAFDIHQSLTTKFGLELALTDAETKSFPTPPAAPSAAPPPAAKASSGFNWVAGAGIAAAAGVLWWASRPPSRY